MNRILSIGHSNHPLDAFLAILDGHRVDAVADVRSTPYSGFNPQYNQEPLSSSLAKRGIRYVFLGIELGGRSNDPSCYENGRVRYDRITETKPFKQGVERLVRGAKEFHIALMCAEKEPLNCHRALHVAPALCRRLVAVSHIHSDGALESHSDAMKRLLKQFESSLEEDLFNRSRSLEDKISDAISLRSRQVAYFEPNRGSGEGGR